MIRTQANQITGVVFLALDVVNIGILESTNNTRCGVLSPWFPFQVPFLMGLSTQFTLPPPNYRGFTTSGTQPLRPTLDPYYRPIPTSLIPAACASPKPIISMLAHTATTKSPLLNTVVPSHTNIICRNKSLSLVKARSVSQAHYKAKDLEEPTPENDYGFS